MWPCLPPAIQMFPIVISAATLLNRVTPRGANALMYALIHVETPTLIHKCLVSSDAPITSTHLETKIHHTSLPLIAIAADRVVVNTVTIGKSMSHYLNVMIGPNVDADVDAMITAIVRNAENNAMTPNTFLL